MELSNKVGRTQTRNKEYRGCFWGVRTKMIFVDDTSWYDTWYDTYGKIRKTRFIFYHNRHQSNDDIHPCLFSL